MELLVAGALGGLGYLFNEKDKNKPTKLPPIVDSSLTHDESQFKGIYRNRAAEDIFNDELDRGTTAYKDAFMRDYLYKDYPETRWADRLYQKSGRLMQLEENIKKPHDWSSTRFPSSDLDQILSTNARKSYNLTKMTDKQSGSINKRRNLMPNPEFTTYDQTKPCEPKIYKTKYPNSKQVRYYKGGHNNLEPFFGGSVKQNTNPDANRTELENLTGTHPVYAHKKPVKRFFPTVKDPWAVSGMPTSSNREMDRYVPAISRQNVLPFEQIRVAPGLNQDAGNYSSTTGFHDPYRALGRGIYKDINDIRVNPKVTYKGRLAGEYFWIPNGVKTAPVISRKPVDLSFSNFPEVTKDTEKECLHPDRLTKDEVNDPPDRPGDNKCKPGKREDFTNNFETYEPCKYHREMLPTIAEVDRAEVQDQDTIVLKEQERSKTGHRLCQYPGHNTRWTKRNQTYLFDTAKETIREQTEDHEHSHINLENNRRGVTTFFDPAKETIREQTEDHMHSHINLTDEDRRGITYFFDKAKETIREQTEDHEHAYINKNDEDRRGVTYYFDSAKETIREQTEDHKHNHINPNGQGKFALHNIVAFLNASINGLKEAAIAQDRAPTTEGVKINADKTKIGKYDIFHRQQFTNYEFTKKHDPLNAPRNSFKQQIGQLTQTKPEYEKDWETNTLRTDPVINRVFREECPYTQSLSTWQVPQNPPYPNKKIVAHRTKFL